MGIRTRDDGNALFDEALASVETGEGLEGYTDGELVELLEHCERNMQLIAAIDVYGDIVAVKSANWSDTRMVMREARAELMRRCDI